MHPGNGACARGPSSSNSKSVTSPPARSPSRSVCAGEERSCRRPIPAGTPGTASAPSTQLDKLLTGRRRFLEPLIGDHPVLDLGCGDGDLSFLFESLGCRVCAIDNPPTNYNRMAGVEALKTALDSSVRIESLDLDGPFHLPVRALRPRPLLRYSLPPQEPLQRPRNPGRHLQLLPPQHRHHTFRARPADRSESLARRLSRRPRRSARRRDQLLDLLRNRSAHPGRSLRMGGLRLARRRRRRLRPVEHAARRASLLPAALARPSPQRPSLNWSMAGTSWRTAPGDGPKRRFSLVSLPERKDSI